MHDWCDCLYDECPFNDCGHCKVAIDYCPMHDEEEMEAE